MEFARKCLKCFRIDENRFLFPGVNYIGDGIYLNISKNSNCYEFVFNSPRSLADPDKEPDMIKFRFDLTEEIRHDDYSAPSGYGSRPSKDFVFLEKIVCETIMDELKRMCEKP